MRRKEKTKLDCFSGFSVFVFISARSLPPTGGNNFSPKTVDVTGDGSKIRCCKEQYCIALWNVRSMNQGKVEVVKQEMARVNIDILGISELKWTGMGEFNTDDHYIYYCGHESHRKNGPRRPRSQQKNPNWSTWVQSQKRQNDLSSFPRQIIQYHSNPSLCCNH